MVSTLRDAKARLSELVQRAAEGEDIVITVRGEPMARLSAVRAFSSRDGEERKWVEETVAAAQAASVVPDSVTSQEFWDDLRSDRV